MTTIGTPHSKNATKFLLLGSGELGKEIAIEAQRFGIEVIAVDRYANAPAMQVAHKSYVISMLDGVALREIIENEQPNFIIPEIEAIATDTLFELEKEGFNIVPNASAVKLTMNREGIRRLVAEKLQLRTSCYQFAKTKEEFFDAVKKIGLPCVIKPIMSSSGKGQSIVRNQSELENAWNFSQTAGRTQASSVIVEEFIPFDYEITLLTVRHRDGTLFCDPIGHLQEKGDYRESWQPHSMSENVLQKAHHIAKTVTNALGGFGIFGVEFFIKDEEVYFSEVSPRPHDTGLVTLISQDLSQFALHVRAILGLPIPSLRQLGPSASCALLAHGHGNLIQFKNIDKVLNFPETQLRLFGKPEVKGERRVGVTLSKAPSISEARDIAKKMSEEISIDIS